MSDVALVKYDAACRAIADAKAVDEVKKIRDVSVAMRAYAKQAKNTQLEIDAAEIRFRAERRVGELMAEQRQTVGLAPAGRPKKIGSDADPISKPTLAEAGIDKHLADRARKLAAVPREQFEGMVGEWRGRVEQENERVTTNLLREGARVIASRDPLDTATEDVEPDEDTDSEALYHLKRHWRMATKKDRKAFRRWIDESH